MKLPQISKFSGRNKETSSSDNDQSAINYTVIDVGASFVRAAIISLTPDQIKILGYGCVQQQPDTMHAGLINQLQILSNTVEQAVTKATNQAGVDSDQVILGFGGSIVSGVSTLARLNRPKPKDQINAKELDQILERVAQNVLMDNQELIAQEMAISQENLRLINAAVTGFALDGYRLLSPVNFTGREIEVGLFTAYVADSTIVALQQILDQLNADLASLTAEPFALAEAVVSTSDKPQQVNAIVLDIGAGVTSATLIENGAVANSQAYPIAGRAITARLSEQMSLPMPEAEKMKLEYSSQSLTGQQHQQVQSIIKDEVDLWLHALSVALSQLSSGQALPDHLYLAGGGSQLPLIEELLNKPKWTKALGFSRQPQVEKLQPNLFNKVIDQTHSLGQADVTLLSLAISWHNRQQEDADIASSFHEIITRLQ